ATYTVKRGDTLSRIARLFGVTVPAILGANPGIRNADRIYPGQRLVIPTQRRFSTANIYVIALQDNGGAGKKIGGGDSVVPIGGPFKPPGAPLRAALDKLLAVKSQWYGQSGLYNALYQSNLHVQRIDMRAREA